ncbi:MAG: hypothetical protein JXN64_13870 [Spirochaetes bacterium]|nr:hypothetical protein [Spirochaetota bacterium]
MLLRITRCTNIGDFRSIGETKICDTLVCSHDFSAVSGYNAGVTLERPDTIMYEARNCGLNYKLQK